MRRYRILTVGEFRGWLLADTTDTATLVRAAAGLAPEMVAVRAPYPAAQIDLRVAGELRGRWDVGRLGQLIVNLLTNAVRYGSDPSSWKPTVTMDR